MTTKKCPRLITFQKIFFCAHPEVRTGSVGWQMIIHIGEAKKWEKRQKSRSGSLEIDVMATSQLLPTLWNLQYIMYINFPVKT